MQDGTSESLGQLSIPGRVCKSSEAKVHGPGRTSQGGWHELREAAHLQVVLLKVTCLAPLDRGLLLRDL